MQSLYEYGKSSDLPKHITATVEKLVNDSVMRNEILVFVKYANEYFTKNKDVSVQDLIISEITHGGLDCYYIVLKLPPKSISLLRDCAYLMTHGKAHVVDVELAYSTQAGDSTLGLQFIWAKEHLYREHVFDKPSPLRTDKGNKRARAETEDHE